jgi:hypothetical protein
MRNSDIAERQEMADLVSIEPPCACLVIRRVANDLYRLRLQYEDILNSTFRKITFPESTRTSKPNAIVTRELSPIRVKREGSKPLMPERVVIAEGTEEMQFVPP